jgi:hypothetical protein
LADTNLSSEKNFEVENFQLLTMIFSENVVSVEIFLEWKWAFTPNQQAVTKNTIIGHRASCRKRPCGPAIPVQRSKGTFTLAIFCYDF